jgi:hypothetical protein
MRLKNLAYSFLCLLLVAGTGAFSQDPPQQHRVRGYWVGNGYPNPFAGDTSAQTVNANRGMAQAAIARRTTAFQNQRSIRQPGRTSQ